MGTYFVFILKSTCCLILFYLFYRLLLSRDTFHRFNRFALLGIIVLSVVIPFIKVVTEEPVIIQRAVFNLETFLQMEPVRDQMEIEDSSLSLALKILFLLYIGGCIFFLSRFLHSTFRIISLIRCGRQIRQAGNFKLIVTPQPISPFSWMQYMVLSQIDMEEGSSEIFIHEQTHIKAGHSWDMLLAGICVVLHWFNPAAWLLKEELQNIHEYEADESVLKRGVDSRKYQLLLIKKAVGTPRFTSMANSFNHSKLKKRISMMTKRKSKPWMRLKFLYIFPLTIIIMIAFARPEISYELDRISHAQGMNMSNTQFSFKKNDTIRVHIAKPFLSKPQKTLEEKAISSLKKENESLSRKEQAIITATIGSPKKLIKDNMGNVDLKLKEIDDRMTTGLSGNYFSSAKEMIPSGIDITPLHRSSFEPDEKKRKSIKENPLFIVDGKEYQYENLKKLNPDLIESITILKDKSEKIYGDKGKNGIILIVLKNDDKKH